MALMATTLVPRIRRRGSTQLPTRNHPAQREDIVVWETALAGRLAENRPDLNALIELYDRTAVVVWAYARQRTRTRQQAREVAIAAYLKAADNPQVFDGKFPIATRMLMLVHLEAEDYTSKA